jgi:hypothetical protein
MKWDELVGDNPKPSCSKNNKNNNMNFWGKKNRQNLSAKN